MYHRIFKKNNPRIKALKKIISATPPSPGEGGLSRLRKIINNFDQKNVIFVLLKAYKFVFLCICQRGKRADYSCFADF